MIMRDKSGRRLLLVLGVVLAVLLIITFIQTRQDSEQDLLPFNRVYPEIYESDILAVQLRHPNSNTTFTIVRNGDNSWIAPDHEGELYQNAATIIARTIVLLPYDRTLPMPENANMSEYGFNPNGQLSVEVLLTNGETHGVLVGRLAPSSGVYYALVDDRPELYLLTRHAIDFLITQLRTPPIA